MLPLIAAYPRRCYLSDTTAMSDTISPTTAAERAIVGAILLRPNYTIPHCADLTVAHFSDAQSRTVFAAILALDDTLNTDMVSVAAELERSGNLDAAGGIHEIAAMCDSAIPEHIAYNVGLVLESYARRIALETVAAIRARIESGESPATLSRAMQEATDRLAIASRVARPPSITAAPALIADSTITEPPQVIANMLYRSGKLIYGGPSKAHKSWTLIDLCIAVASGGRWLDMQCSKGRALYIDFELIRYDEKRRIEYICDARGIEVPDTLDVWNLRGSARPLDQLIPLIDSHIRRGGDPYTIIVPDPIYKTLEGRDENSATEMALLCREIERLATHCNAAVAYGAHFAKGNASAKDSMDRISGSGVFARDPDAILTATPHEIDLCYVIDPILRSFPPIDPFGVRWDFPRMVREHTLDVEALKGRTGRPMAAQPDELLGYLEKGDTVTTWRKRCLESGGISKDTFFRRKKDLIRNNRISQVGESISLNMDDPTCY